jgi:hypothetical protein
VTLREVHVADRWTEPAVEWRPGIDCAAKHQWLVAHGELLVTWPPTPFEETATDCFRVGQHYWIWQPGVGGIRFSEDPPTFLAFPSAQIDRTSFDYLITRSWLPVVYQVWGRQVLHASAIACGATGDVVAFAGPSQAGKSTMAYGLGQRAGWGLVCDDTMAFSSGEDGITLHRLQNEARLRPASAAYYGRTDAAFEPVSWPARSLRLTAVYFLDGDPNLPHPALITRLRAAESYPLLLEQAYALTLKLPKHNQQLMRDYLDLAAAVPVFRLAYRKSFEAVEEVFDVLENHLRTADGLVRSTAATLSTTH